MTAILKCRSKRYECWRAIVEVNGKRWYPHFPTRKAARDFINQILIQEGVKK